ncbi:MAG: DUF456 domain-containing protein [Anaerolineae bacterium]|nr:MAG: DUF456 domain-containing protein [Anaerolineae bacterium]
MPAWIETSIRVISLLVMALGLFGLVIPIFPGIIIIWLAALAYGLVAGFGTLGGWMFVLITLLAIGGMLVDNVLMGAGAKQGGASWLGMGVALLGFFVGALVVPVVGGLVLGPLALFAFEYYRHRDRDKALDTVKGLAAGWGLSFVARFGIGLVMIVLWAVWAF